MLPRIDAGRAVAAAAPARNREAATAADGGFAPMHFIGAPRASDAAARVCGHFDPGEDPPPPVRHDDLHMHPRQALVKVDFH